MDLYIERECAHTRACAAEECWVGTRLSWPDPHCQFSASKNCDISTHAHTEPCAKQYTLTQLNTRHLLECGLASPAGQKFVHLTDVRPSIRHLGFLSRQSVIRSYLIMMNAPAPQPLAPPRALESIYIYICYYGGLSIFYSKGNFLGLSDGVQVEVTDK